MASNEHRARLLLVVSALFIFLGMNPVSSEAQTVDDNAATEYATGLIFEEPEVFEALPRAPGERANIPPVVDLSKRFPPPGDQGSKGSCVGWAVGYAARSYYNYEKTRNGRYSSRQIASPGFLYDSIRPGDCDRGSRTVDALNFLKNGTLSHKDYPYSTKTCRRPSDSEKSKANGFKIDTWLTVDPNDPNNAKIQLKNGNPVVVSIRTTRSFSRLTPGYSFNGKPIWNPDPSERKTGAHAVTLVGYREDGQYFKFINSWSQRWGDRGYGRLSYDAYRNFVYQAFVMRPLEPPEPPKPDPVPVPEVDIVLPSPSCGSIKATDDNGVIRVTGFVGKDSDIAEIRKSLSKRASSISVEVQPWPICEALQTLEEPASEKNRPKIELANSVYELGSNLTIKVKQADYQGYLHIAYLQSDGTVVHLAQTGLANFSTLPPNSSVIFGDGKEGRDEFTLYGSTGREMIIALASKSPVFSSPRPEDETERSFLTALSKAIRARPDKTSPERFISASYRIIEVVE